MYTKFQHTCGICRRRFYTAAEADAHAFDHECGRIEQQAVTDAPAYALLFLDENTETQGIATQGDDVASLLALRELLTFYANGLHYGVICLAEHVRDEHDADVLAEIAALTADDLRVVGQ
jgi:hypothetical protein